METSWVPIYKKIASLLDDWFQTSPSDAGERLYRACMDDMYQEEFIRLNPWIKKFKKVWDVQSVDPLHVFASFNHYNISESVKKEKLNLLHRILTNGRGFEELANVNLDIFKYFPHINITRVVGARSDKDQEVLWALFHEVLNKTFNQEQNINQLFDRALKCYGVAIPSLTIFMFWINPDKYLPLDKNTFSLLEQKNKQFFGRYKNAHAYFSLLRDDINNSTNLYRNLAYIALDTKKNIQKIQSNQTEIKEVEDYLLFIQHHNAPPRIDESFFEEVVENKSTQKSLLDSLGQESINVFAIRVLDDKEIPGHWDDKYVKNLQKNYTYQLNHVYRVIDDNRIEYLKGNDIDIYSDKTGFTINISAIVGANGSGKSALTELFLLAINNLAALIDKKNNTDLEAVSNFSIAVEIYFSLGNIYKAKITDSEYEIYQYQKETFDSPFYIKNSRAEESFELKNLFYTLYSNYSIHSLNSSLDQFEWLDKLFHKQDVYQTPIVIEPERKQGNIDINHVNSVTVERLLVRLLLESEAPDYRRLTEAKEATRFQLAIKPHKIQRIRDFFESHQANVEQIAKYFFGESFEIVDHIERQDPKSYAILYVIYKTIRIHESYQLIYGHYSLETDLKEYLELLMSNKSHISYKLKRALNFYKVDGLNDIYSTGEKLTFSDISDKLVKMSLETGIDILELTPPAFFESTIYLYDKEEEKEVEFESLSSGEKQIIYSINDLIYHLINLNSLHTYEGLEESVGLYVYKHVIIVLDEIELYFHPEMQRTYIQRLIRSLQDLGSFENLLSLNIIFITHSPFILSDILPSNVLSMDQEDNTPLILNSFAANIHEMLARTFMADTIGEFARNKIGEIVSFHATVINRKDVHKLRKEYEDKKNEFTSIVKNIGEDYLRSVLRNHLDEVERILAIHEDPIEQKIKFHTLEIEKLNAMRGGNHVKD